MTAFSTYLADALLNHLFRGVALPMPTSLWVGLSSTATSDAGAYTEPAGNGYVRPQVPCNVGQWNAPFAESSQRRVSNVNPVPFGPATGNWGTLSHLFIADAAVAGNVLFHGPITGGSITVNTGQAYAIAAGLIKPGLSGSLTDYLADALLNHLFRGSAYPLLAALYAGLSTTATNAAGAKTEPGSASYDRVAIPCATDQWSAPATVSSGRQTANLNATSWPVATENWPATPNGFLADAASGGNVLWHGALSSSVTILTTQNLVIDPGQFTAYLT